LFLSKNIYKLIKGQKEALIRPNKNNIINRQYSNLLVHYDFQIQDLASAHLLSLLLILELINQMLAMELHPMKKFSLEYQT
jgi:hypothetical protein